ncbi:MAG: hypothetical protein LBK61_06580 [Spirochaetaceae bacterium]|jgi:hypothetical protein|nr:hypothetical protein [Spirochaetaceae bacterium]
MSEQAGSTSPYGTFIEAEGEFAKQIGFLARAASRDPTRPSMQNILIERIEPAELAEGTEPRKGALKGVATDGRRLHIIAPLACPEGVCGLEAGQWRILRAVKKFVWIAKANNCGNFPNWRKVIPVNEPVLKTEYRSGWDKAGVPALVEAVRLCAAISCAAVINPEHLADLDKGDEAVWDVSWHGTKLAAVFENGGCKALIMPAPIEERNKR